MGRWGIQAIGGYRFDDIYEPTKIESIELGQDVEEVDATGFYCALIKADHYLKHTFEPYEDVLGPDVNLGLALRRQGLLNYMDFSVKVDHLTSKGKLEVKRDTIQTVTFIKDNGWRQKSS